MLSYSSRGWREPFRLLAILEGLDFLTTFCGRDTNRTADMRDPELQRIIIGKCYPNASNQWKERASKLVIVMKPHIHTQEEEAEGGNGKQREILPLLESE